MKYKISLLLKILSPILLIIGGLGLFFGRTLYMGYILFALGSSFGLIGAALSSKYDSYERFSLLTSCLAFALLGVFMIAGILQRVVILALLLFVIDFVLMVIDMKTAIRIRKKKKVSPVEKSEKYKKFNEKEIYNELETIKDEVAHIQILEEGDINDVEDFSVKKQAEQIKKEFSEAIVVQDPKEGRYFFKENGKTFHAKGCIALRKMNKKEIKSSNSRTGLLARGYKSCKICNS